MNKQRAVRRRRVIGLLGGSFNPAHDGHRQISLAALRRLEVDGVWWLVSPQNPLKSTDGMRSLETRLQRARRVARHPDITVTDIETRLQTQYTADTLRALVKVYPRHRFVWLMGADNLAQIHRWQDWEEIFSTVHIGVFARPPYGAASLNSVAARRYARNRVSEKRARHLLSFRPPAWVFLRIRLLPVSASRIRR